MVHASGRVGAAVIRTERFGAAYSTATLAFGAGLLVGPQLGGILADRTDSFRPVFVVVIGCALGGAGLAMCQPADKHQEFPTTLGIKSR